MEPVAGSTYTAVVHIVTMLLQEMTHWIHLLFFCLVGTPLFVPVLVEASPRPGSVGPSLVPNGDQCLQNELVISLTESDEPRDDGRLVGYVISQSGEKMGFGEVFSCTMKISLNVIETDIAVDVCFSSTRSVNQRRDLVGERPPLLPLTRGKNLHFNLPSDVNLRNLLNVIISNSNEGWRGKLQIAIDSRIQSSVNLCLPVSGQIRSTDDSWLAILIIAGMALGALLIVAIIVLSVICYLRCRSQSYYTDPAHHPQNCAVVPEYPSLTDLNESESVQGTYRDLPTDAKVPIEAAK